MLDPAEVFEQHFEFFDRRLRECLRVYGVSYEPNDVYYNEVFFHVYQRVFREERLRRYDPSKGSLRGWLGEVVLNEVRDWLKSAHPTLPLSRGTEATGQSRAWQSAVSLDSATANGADPLPLHDLLADPRTDPRSPREDTARRQDALDAAATRALGALIPEHRAAFEILALGFRPLSDASVEWVAATRGVSPEEVGVKVNEISRRLENVGARETEMVERALGVCAEMTQGALRRVQSTESKLRALGLSQASIEGLLQKAERLTFAEIEATRPGKTEDLQGRGSLEVDLMARHRRWRKWCARRERALEEYRCAAALCCPTYRDIGSLMGKPESAMAGLLYRAKKNFLRNLRAEEEKAGISRSA